MARTVLTKTTAPSPYATAGTAVTFTAADTTNQNRFILTGRQIIIARNTGASTRTVTITSIADPIFGRSGTISAENITAGQVKVYGAGLATDGWLQTDGYLYLEANHAEVEFAVIDVPNLRA